MQAGLQAFRRAWTTHLLPTARSFAVSVDVRNNNVDRAMGRIKSLTRDSGLEGELNKREYRVPGSERTARKRLQKYNQRMGSIIRERLKWLAKHNSTK